MLRPGRLRLAADVGTWHSWRMKWPIVVAALGSLASSAAANRVQPTACWPTGVKPNVTDLRMLNSAVIVCTDQPARDRSEPCYTFSITGAGPWPYAAQPRTDDDAVFELQANIDGAAICRRHDTTRDGPHCTKLKLAPIKFKGPDIPVTYQGDTSATAAFAIVRTPDKKDGARGTFAIYDGNSGKLRSQIKLPKSPFTCSKPPMVVGETIFVTRIDCRDASQARTDLFDARGKSLGQLGGTTMHSADLRVLNASDNSVVVLAGPPWHLFTQNLTTGALAAEPTTIALQDWFVGASDNDADSLLQHFLMYKQTLVLAGQQGLVTVDSTTGKRVATLAFPTCAVPRK